MVQDSYDLSMDNNVSEGHPLYGWTRKEKIDLLLLIKTYSSHDIQQMVDDIPTKTENQIVKAIDYYRKYTLYLINSKQKPIIKPMRSKLKDKNRVPLAKWAELVSDFLPYKDFHTETADAVRLIAYFEDEPDPTDGTEETMEFNKVYRAMADAMEGRPLPKDPLLLEFFNICLVDTIEKCRNFINSSLLRNIINSIDLESEMKYVFSDTSDEVLLILRELYSQRNYNPLDISDEYLKPSSET